MAAQDRGRGRSRSRYPVRFEFMVDTATAKAVRAIADATERTHSQMARLLLAYGLDAWNDGATVRTQLAAERRRKLGIDDG